MGPSTRPEMPLRILRCFLLALQKPEGRSLPRPLAFLSFPKVSFKNLCSNIRRRTPKLFTFSDLEDLVQLSLLGSEFLPLIPSKFGSFCSFSVTRNRPLLLQKGTELGDK